jgi:hypothetical protein
MFCQKIMKTIWIALISLILIGCDKPVRSGTAKFIHFRTGETSTSLLAGPDYDGNQKATSTLKWRNPMVVLFDSYIEISYPGTDKPMQTIPRESLIEIAWQ